MSADGGGAATDVKEVELGTGETAAQDGSPSDTSQGTGDKEANSASAQETPSTPTKTSKVDVLLKPAGNAPILKKKRWTVDRHKKIGWITDFIRKFIRTETEDSVFVYVNQSFAPSPDTDIGSLFDCFGSDGKLVIYYCRTQAWG